MNKSGSGFPKIMKNSILRKDFAEIFSQKTVFEIF